MSKFSSFRKNQMLFESWRSYINEDLEVVLTNEEAGELFGEEIEDLLDGRSIEGRHDGEEVMAEAEQKTAEEEERLKQLAAEVPSEEEVKRALARAQFASAGETQRKLSPRPSFTSGAEPWQVGEPKKDLQEKSVSKKQQRFMGMVHACKKSNYKDCASPEVEEAARSMKEKDAKEYAETKHKGLPEEV